MKSLTNEELTFCVKVLSDALNGTVFFEQDKEKSKQKAEQCRKVKELLGEIFNE